MDILIKTPENWLEILRDLDFSAFNKYMPRALQLTTELQNKKQENRVRLDYEIKVPTDKEGNDFYNVHLSIGRSMGSDETPKPLQGTGDWIFDYNRIKPPLTIPEFVKVKGNGLKVIDKLVNDFFPGLIKQGYDFNIPLIINSVRNNYYDMVVLIKENSTEIKQLDDLEWITENKLNQLKKKYGEIEKVAV